MRPQSTRPNQQADRKSELADSPEAFRILVEGVKDYAIFMLDPEGYIQTWNPGAQRMKGYSADEIIGKHFSIFYEPDAVAAAHPEYELKIARKLGRYEEEGWRVRKDGTRFWANVVISCITDEQGKVIGFAKVTRDLTERKRAEEVERREERFRTLAESIPQLCWIARADGYITWFNKRWYDYAGRSREQAKGWGWESVIHPEDLPRILQEWRKSLEEGAPFESEFKIMGRDGKFRWFLTRVNPVRDSDGRVVLWFGTNTDIDNERRIREALGFLAEASSILLSSLDYHETLKHLSQLAVPRLGDWCSIYVVENGEPRLVTVAHPDPEMLKVAEDYRSRYPTDWNASRGVARVLATGESELYPEVTDELLRSEIRDEEHLRFIQKLKIRSIVMVPIAGRKSNLGVLTLVSSQLGRYDSASRVIAENLGTRAGLAIENARLFAQSRQQLEKLATEHQIREQMIATLSHDLRNPLSAVKSSAQIILRYPDKADSRERLLAKIVHGAERADRMIQDLLDVSRIKAGERVPLSITECDLSAVLSETVEELSVVHGNRFVMEGPEHLPGYWGCDALRRVIENLCNNAVKYGAPDYPIRITMSSDGFEIRISVNNRGPVIPSDQLARLFEPFHRSDEAVVSGKKGWGLGLALVKGIVESHGGAVNVSSTAEEGTTFTLVLPRDARRFRIDPTP